MGDLKQLYAAARLRLAADTSYFWLASVVYLFGEPIWTPRVPTLGVDKHARLYINPEYFRKHEVATITALLVHEAGHVAGKHWLRAGELGVPPHRQGVANVAQDACINEAGCLHKQLPSNCVRADDYDLEPGLPWEVYYRQLCEKQPPLDLTINCGSAAHGYPADWELPAGDSQVPGACRELIDAVIYQAAKDALSPRGRGTVPEGWLRWAEKIAQPTINWDSHLLRGVTEFTTQQAGSDYTDWRRLSRRRAQGTVIFPGKRATSQRLAMVIDTSGSMSESDLGRALGVVESALATRRLEVTVYATDAAAKPSQRVRCARETKLIGGGGTDMREGLREVEKAKPGYALAVVVTDGMTPWPEQAPPVPVLVVILHEKEKFPSWSGVLPHKQLRWVPPGPKL